MNYQLVATHLVVWCGVALSAFATQSYQVRIVRATNTIQNMQSHPNFLFDARVILPDGSHAEIICDSMARGCAGIEAKAPEKMAPGNNECYTTPDGTMMTCTKNDLGLYQARRDGNKLIIKAPNGKLVYHIVCSW